jgi:L-alanine-DL-glutamate epimerase-like enolase superfamily enzyme
MKIKDIRASVHTTSIDVPLLDGKVAGYGREEQREFVFCEVETDDGLTGVALTGHFLARAVVVALEQHFLPVVVDLDPREIEAVHQRVWRTLNPRAMTGVVSSALSLLDIALWDIAGKAQGRSVASLLPAVRPGAARRGRAPAARPGLHGPQAGGRGGQGRLAGGRRPGPRGAGGRRARC